MDAFEIARVILFLSLGGGFLFASIQLGRVFGQLAGIIKDSRKTLERVENITQSFEDDYKKLRDKVFSIIDFLEAIITSLTGVVGITKIASVLQTWFNNRDSNSSKKVEEGDEK